MSECIIRVSIFDLPVKKTQIECDGARIPYIFAQGSRYDVQPVNSVCIGDAADLINRHNLNLIHEKTSQNDTVMTPDALS